MNDLIQRWSRAAERAAEEQVRVVAIDGSYFATSSSQPLKAYRLARERDRWHCECIANGEYGLPCKHLWALCDLLSLDVFSDVHVDWPGSTTETEAA
jgi:hypothetical protein